MELIRADDTVNHEAALVFIKRRQARKATGDFEEDFGTLLLEEHEVTTDLEVLHHVVRNRQPNVSLQVCDVR